MKIRFWGVRGSIPSPGKSTVEFGGNTSCVEVVTNRGTSLIFDAGSGIREMGIDYLKREGASRELHLFISHAHWDHIQGFPFFTPALLKDFTIHFYGGIDTEDILTTQMKAPFFPIPIDIMQSQKHFHVIEKSGVEIDGCRVFPFPLVHTQEVLGFRVEENEKTVCYSSDTEYEFGSSTHDYIESIRNADVLIYDAQYTPEQYSNGKVGWGHSTYEDAVEISKKTNVKKLVLFHHEPTHNDATIRKIEKEYNTDYRG